MFQADVYVLPLIVYEPPEQKLCGLLVTIAAASPTTTARVSVHPQLSVTVTVYVPELKPEGSSEVEPLSQE